MRQNNKYSGDFKVEVAQAYLSGKYSSTKEVAQTFGVTNRSQVGIWTKLYQEDPMKLYLDSRGRPPKQRTKSPKSTSLKDMSLEEQNHFLRMENDILKKLRRAVKYQVIDLLKNKYTIGNLCAYLQVARSSYYAWIAQGRPLHKGWKRLGRQDSNSLCIFL